MQNPSNISLRNIYKKNTFELFLMHLLTNHRHSAQIYTKNNYFVDNAFAPNSDYNHLLISHV